MTLAELLNSLWNQYVTDTPEAGAIHQLFVSRGETMVNDHIAIRTFDDERICVDQLAKPFMDLGYVEKGAYTFPVKKLTAKHYEHPDATQPKIFISQLQTGEFSSSLQRRARDVIDSIGPSLIDQSELLFSGTTWPLDHDVYSALLDESEYAAWLYVFGFRANHFTVSINHLNSFPDIQSVNAFLKANGYQLNDAGGEIKGTPQQLLEQSSTRAQSRTVSFSQGAYEIRNSYYEFALRYPQANGELFLGFIAASADKIFESTDTDMT